MKTTLITLTATAVAASSASAVTNFTGSPNAVDTAAWDIWVDGPAGPPGIVNPGTSYNQGAAPSVSAGVTSSAVTTDIINDFSNPPGGVIGGGDRFYIHDGAYTWNATIDTAAAFNFVRISYKLLGFGGAAPTDFAATPTIAGATQIASNSYGENDGTVFYYDFQLDAPGGTSVATSFGDVVTPGFFPGSFRSIDGIQVETFTVTPISVPEPSSALLLGLGSFALVMRRRK